MECLVPVAAELRGITIKINNQKCKPIASSEDINKDGLMDLVVHFDTNYLQLKDTDTEAILEGKTLDGLSITGKDSVKIISSKKSKFQYSIDSCIKLTQAELMGLNHGPARPVGVIINHDGTRDEFVMNEVVLNPKSQEDLTTFLNKYHGTILRQSPSPPPDSDVYYLIRVDLSTSSLNDLIMNMETNGLKGYFVFSSEDASRLAALVARETNKGVSPNFLMKLPSVPEHPNGFGGNLDAEKWWWMTEDDDPNTPADQGLSVGVIHAWEYLRYMGVPPLLGGEWSPARIAIIDCGFALDETTGVPLNNNIDYQNSLQPPWQWDLIDYDATAGGPCTIEGAFKWHGQGTFGAAAAYPRNLFGSAGTGGDVVIPMLLKHDGSWFNIGDGIRKAAQNGAKVIIPNGVSECNWWCRQFSSDYNNLKNGLNWAAYENAIVVAPAGNHGWDISDRYMIPCSRPGVICVGSLDKNRSNLFNYGQGVDIWAPSGIYSTVTPDTANNVGANALLFASGTSISTPFVGGIVGLMKALDPSLNYDSVRNILISTANPSPDVKISTGYVDAYRAVAKVRQNQPPLVKITTPLDGASISYGSAYFSAEISDPESPSIFGGTIRWSVANYDFCTSTICSGVKFKDLFNDPIGQYTVYARGIDQFGAIGSDSITINVINNPPSIDIIKPLDGATYFSNQIISFASYTFDVDQDTAYLGVSWSSNRDGPINPSTKLSIGNHIITATVTDELGLTAQDTITINVLSGEGYPTVTILNPSGISSFPKGKLITFEGSATDPEDGTLADSSLEWSSDKDGLLGTGNSIKKILSGSGSCMEGESKTHIVTLNATDSDGHKVGDQITVYINSPC